MFIGVREMKKYILPVLAVLCAVAAIIVIAAVPQNSGSGIADGGQNTGTVQGSAYVERNEEGDIVIRAEALSKDTISFYQVEKDSAVELIAILDEDGTARAALGTCQSCNGSPNAYYTQNGNLLQCNNCGLTFPLSVIGVDGAGCHPIMIDQSAIKRNGNDLIISAASLRAYEPLFAKISMH